MAACWVPRHGNCADHNAHRIRGTIMSSLSAEQSREGKGTDDDRYTDVTEIRSSRWWSATDAVVCHKRWCAETRPVSEVCVAMLVVVPSDASDYSRAAAWSTACILSNDRVVLVTLQDSVAVVGATCDEGMDKSVHDIDRKTERSCQRWKKIWTWDWV